MVDTMCKESREAGFTLVELMIVIVILAILVAVLTPSFINGRKRAIETAAALYGRQVAERIINIYAQNDADNRAAVAALDGTTVECNDSSIFGFFMTADDLAYPRTVEACQIESINGQGTVIVTSETGGVHRRSF